MRFFILICISIFVVSQVISVVRYLLIDERPFLPRGYAILTNGVGFKWRKYYPFLFHQYTSKVTGTTKESAITAVLRWIEAEHRKKPKYIRVTLKED